MNIIKVYLIYLFKQRKKTPFQIKVGTLKYHRLKLHSEFIMQD